tara:strand:- start:244 stop:1788 length:1545 start_codon:yes stop_codon:yes gene_type:complete
MALTQTSTNGIKDATIATADIAADAVTGAKIADDAVGSEHIEVLDAALQFGDSVKAQFGTGNDLEIFHDGTNSYIDNTLGTGTFYVRGDALYLQTSQSTPETHIAMDSGTGPRLYHNNIKCFETNNNGIEVFGPEGGDAIIRLSADERDDDADKWRLHAEADSTQFKIENYNSGAWETNIKAVGDGAVELYYDNVKKAATATSGLAITGSLTFTQTGQAISLHDDRELHVGSGDDLKIYHLSSDNNSYIIEGGSGSLMIQGDTINLGNVGTTEYYVRCFENGAVQVRYDNSTKLETLTNGAKTSGNHYLQGTGTVELAIGSTDAGGAKLTFDGDSNGDWSGGDYSSITHTTSGDMEYDADNPSGATNHIFKAAGSEKLRFQAAGGISFNGDTAAANAIDDYEEGSWSPAMSANAQTADGRYTKIGRMVHALFHMSVGSNSTSSDMVITGLPFTPAAHNGNLSGNVSVSSFGAAFYVFSDSSANIYVRNLSNGTIPMSDFSQKWIYGELHYITAA